MNGIIGAGARIALRVGEKKGEKVGGGKLVVVVAVVLVMLAEDAVKHNRKVV